MKWMSKRSRILLAIALVAVLSLAGCDLLAGIFDPLIGKWQYSLTIGPATMTVVYEFHSDLTWNGTMTATGQTDQTVSGTYTKDSAAGTITMTATTGSSPGTQTLSYAISKDNKTLTLTQNGVSMAFTRM